MRTIAGQVTVPDDQTAIAMQTAHRLADTIGHLAHGAERLQAAREATVPKLRQYHSAHLVVHVERALDAGHELATNLRQHYPGEGAELDALSKAIGLARALSDDAKAATSAHLLESVLHDAAHAARHARAMLAPGSDQLWKFNHAHAKKHLAGAREHARKLADHLTANYPAEARFLAGLPTATAAPRGYS